MDRYTLGVDPEVSVVDDDTGEFISAHNLLPGSKESPFMVLNGLGAVQPDGVAAEFNIRPCSTSKDFVEAIELVMAEMGEMIRNVRPNSTLSLVPVANFDPSYLKSLPDDAQALGCMPDFDAYTGGVNNPPDPTTSFRTNSGHLHIGWEGVVSEDDPGHQEKCRSVVKQLDSVLYFNSLIWTQNDPDDEKRRQMYGRIGAMRYKPYGVEWRPLSNLWLREKSTIEYVWDTTQHLMTLLDNGVKIYEDKETIELVTQVRSNALDKNRAIAYASQYIPQKYGVDAYA